MPLHDALPRSEMLAKINLSVTHGAFEKERANGSARGLPH
jgi:hypothetical protein